MKKLLMILLLSSSLFAKSNPGEIDFEPKVGIGVAFGVDSENIEIEGFTVAGLETYYRVSPRVDFGLGALYLKGAASKVINNETEETEDIIKIPVYFATKIHIFPNWAVNPYTKFMYGYQFILDNDIIGKTNGKYMGIALGLDVEGLTAETFITLEGNYENEDNYRGAMGYGFSLGYRY